MCSCLHHGKLVEFIQQGWPTIIAKAKGDD